MYKKNLLSSILTLIGGLLFISTELLSLFHILTPWNIRIFWIVIIFIITIILFYHRKVIVTKIHHLSINNPLTAIYYFALVIWLAYVGYMAHKIVPNNWDSMVYHLPRIMSWLQYKSVDYYPCLSSRQLVSPPLTEYAQMHVYCLLGGDTYINMVQYISYVISIPLIHSICRKLDFSVWCARISSLIYISMPIVIAEAVTTQVDLFGTLWLLVAIDLIIDLVNLDQLSCHKETIIPLITCGAAMGLGYLAKSTVCIPLLSFLIWLLIVRIKKSDNVKILLLCALIAGSICIAIVLPSFIRNYIYVGNVFNSGYTSTLSIGSFDPRLMVLNLYKNWAINAATVWDKNILVACGYTMATLLQCNLNDERITWGGMKFDDTLFPSYMHDHAKNPTMSWMLLAAFVMFIIIAIIRKRNKYESKKRGSLLTLFGAFTLGYISVRSQQYGTRLLIPASACACVFIAGVIDETRCIVIANSKIENIKTLPAILIVAIGILVSFDAIPTAQYQMQYVNEYKEHPEYDRFWMYFYNNPDARGAYYDACEIIEKEGYNDIGIYGWGDPYEYPLWSRLKTDDTRIVHVVPDGELCYAPDRRIAPQCILAFGRKYGIGSTIEYLGHQYECVHHCHGVDDYPFFVEIG